MFGFILSRFLQAVVVVFAMSVIVFVGVYAIGNPIDVMIDPGATAEIRENLIRQYGLDQPLWRQYLTFLGNVAEGDLGRSMVYNTPVTTLIFSRLPATLELVTTSLVLSLVIGLPLGLWAGMKPGSMTDESVMTGSILGFSLPNFWQGMMLIMIFSVWLGWLPSTGRGDTGQVLGLTTSYATWDGFIHLLLPATNLALAQIALVIRLTRTGVQETMPLDFVKFARARGLPMRRIVGVHVMKNILIPIVTVLGIEFGTLIAFAVVTETIFAWPGIGKLIIDSINALDRPIIVSYILIVVAMFIVINLLVDLAYSLLDPRIRDRAT